MAPVKTYGTPDVAVVGQAEVGEGPVWDPRTGRLCWVDIVQGQLIESDLGGGQSTTTVLQTMLGAAVPRTMDAGFAAAASDGLGLVQTGELRVVDPVVPDPNFRMNDAKCDSTGRLWAGSTHCDFESGCGALHRWDGSSPSEAVVTGLTLPNGMGWNNEDTLFFLVDSMARTIFVADFDSAEGRIGPLRPFCTVSEGLPDGMAVDMEGCIWVAIYGGWCVQRYSPKGELIERVPMPVAQPTSCAFDADGSLYVTSARAGLDPNQLQEQPTSGSIFAVSTAERGVQVHGFAG